MPFRCCVTECTGNYETGPKVQVFSFPKEENAKRKWLRSIPRDFGKNGPYKTSRVCEKHSEERFFIRFSTFYDGKTGKIIQVPLKVPRLTEDAYPSLFPGCPSYLSSSFSISRESPEVKLQRKERENFHRAVQESLKSSTEHEERKKFSTISELSECSKNASISDIWTVVTKSHCVMFLHITENPGPLIKFSVTVNELLKVKIFIRNIEVKCLLGLGVPDVVNDFRIIENILDKVVQMDSSASNSTNFLYPAIESLLEHLKNSLSDDKQQILKFLMEQIDQLNRQTPRYSAESMIFSSLLFTISPHAYKFLRNSGILTLPHPETIRKICSCYNFRPQNEQMDKNFLAYMKCRINSLASYERRVILMIDEIYLKPYFDYKGGEVVGMSYNNDAAATTAHVFMLQSLLSAFKEVALIEELDFKYVLLGKIQTDSLENRFGQYRQLSRSQYHVSIRQIYESEKKLRLQSILPIIPSDYLKLEIGGHFDSDVKKLFSFETTNSDIQNESDHIQVITYVAGYCALTTLKYLKCEFCKLNLILDRDLEIEQSKYSLIKHLDRGGLKYLTPSVINYVMFNEIIVKKLISPENLQKFGKVENQCQLIIELTLEQLVDFDDIDVCNEGHTPELVMRKIIKTSTNILLNNFCSQQNDKLVLAKVSSQRKANAFSFKNK